MYPAHPAAAWRTMQSTLSPRPARWTLRPGASRRGIPIQAPEAEIFRIEADPIKSPVRPPSNT